MSQNRPLSQKEENMFKVGFIGIGLMGLPMCRRLLAAKVDLWVWNRTVQKCQGLSDEGALVAKDLSELASQVDVIMICVSDSHSVQAVHEQLLPHLHTGQIIVDFSSISPEVTVQLHESVAQKAVSWIDSPVSGGVAGAQAGTLAIMVGGEISALNKVEPLLKHLSQSVTHMGPSGSGQTTKICNQMLVSCNVLVMAEVMAMAKRAGVDASKIPTALKGGFADSIPLQLTGTRMAKGDFDEVKWRTKTLLKDLDMAADLAKEMGSAIPMAGLGAQIMRQHAANGYDDKDPSTLVKLYDQPETKVKK